MHFFCVVRVPCCTLRCPIISIMKTTTSTLTIINSSGSGNSRPEPLASSRPAREPIFRNYCSKDRPRAGQGVKKGEQKTIKHGTTIVAHQEGGVSSLIISRSCENKKISHAKEASLLGVGSRKKGGRGEGYICIILCLLVFIHIPHEILP